MAKPPNSLPNLLRNAAAVYGALFLAAVLWRVGLSGESLLYASEHAAVAGLRPLPDAFLGLATGAALVAMSRLWTARARAGRELAAALSELLGPLSRSTVLALAVLSGVAEEAFFRGALQPVVGLPWASLLFGLAHFVPRRELWIWSVVATLGGLVLGALFELTGNLIAPIAAHASLNALNLRWLAEREPE